MKRLRAIAPITLVTALFLLCCWAWSIEFDIADAGLSIGGTAGLLLNVVWCWPLLAASFLLCLRALSREEPLGSLAVAFVAMACIFTVSVLLFRGSQYGGALPTVQAVHFVDQYGDDMEAYYHSGGQLPQGVQAADVQDWSGEHPYLEISLGAWGIVPSSTYYGCYYSPDDVPLPFQNLDMPLTQESPNYWTWQEETGDDHGVTKKLREGWYFYQASF